jgi:hypothetical protein
LLVLVVWQQQQHQNFWLGWLAGVGAGGVERAAPFRLSPFARLRCCNSRRKHRCFGAAHPAAAAALAAPLSCPWLQAASKPAGLRRRRGMCLGADRMRLGASEARIGVSCTGRALQRACSIFLQGLTGRGGSWWPPFAALRCWSLLVSARSHRNAGGREGVGKGALSSEFSSLRTRTVLALSQIRPCNTTPSGQAWSGKPNLHRNNTTSLLGLAVGGRHCLGVCSRTIPTNRAGVCNGTRPTSPGNVYLASFQAYIQRRSFARLLQPSFLHSRAVLSCQRNSAGSVRQQAATPAQQGEQGTPFAGYAM